MILVKKLKFFHLLGLSKIDREKVFADVLDNINMDLKRRQNWHFCIVHDFGQKVEVFSSWVFIKNRSRKSVC